MSEAPLPTSPPPKRRNWIKIALIVSLAFNALVIGVVVRTVWQFRSAVMMSGAGLETRLPAFIGSLPRERRDELRREAVMERPDAVLRPLRVELRRMRSEATRVFLAEPFDKQAFIEAQAKVSEAEAALRRAVQGMLPEIADRMTAEERRDFIRWRGPGRGPGGRGGGGSSFEDGQDERPGGRRRP